MEAAEASRRKQEELSGWATYERCACTQMKRFEPEDAGSSAWQLVLHLDDPKGISYTGPQKHDPWAARRTWPIGPDDFDAMVSLQGFADEADLPLVQGLFRKMRNRQLGGSKALKFDNRMPAPTPEDARRLGRCINAAVNVERISLADVGMSDAASVMLFSQLGHGSLEKLTKLTLFNNSIADDGCRALARAAIDGAMPELKQLYLGSNLINDRGARALTDAIANEGAFPALEVLCLGQNSFSDEARAEIAQACSTRGIRALKDRIGEEPLWTDPSDLPSRHTGAGRA